MLYFVQGRSIFGLLDKEKEIALQPTLYLSTYHFNLGGKDIFRQYKKTHIRNYKTAMPPQFILGGVT